MNVLILGSNGMLGHTLALLLLEQGINVIGIARNDNPFIKTILYDLNDLCGLETLINNANYDYIVNCAAILVNDSEINPYKAIIINSLLPHKLHDITKTSNTKIIHISTDSVFSGQKKDLYYDNDPQDPVRLYDRTKSLGEIRYENCITIRTSIIGLESSMNGKSLLNWVLFEDDVINGFKDVVWCGMTNVELSKAIIRIIKGSYEYGKTYNISNNIGISKLDLITLLVSKFKYKPNQIITDDSFRSTRILAHSEKLVDIVVPDYVTMINEMHEFIIKHSFYYEQIYGKQLFNKTIKKVG